MITKMNYKFDSTGMRGKSFLLNTIFFSSILALSAQGLLNFVFRGTPLTVWKQALTSALLIASIFYFRSRKLAPVYAFVLFCSAMLVLASFLTEGNIQRATQHIIYYIGWLPFFAWGASIGPEYIKKYFPKILLIFIIASSIGILLQLYTPWFNFLIDAAASFQYAIANNTVKRYGFYFVASTVVLPTLFGAYTCYYISNKSTLGSLTPIPFLALAAVPTGSLAAFITVLGCALLSMSINRGSVLKSLIIYVAASAAMFIVIIMTKDHMSSSAQIQIDRVLGNDVYSESNRGRLVLWSQAIDIIAHFNPLQHMIGQGLGTTSAERLSLAVSIHGESSIFQAYLEGGLLGIFVRFLPFAMILFAYRSKIWLTANIYSLFLFISVATAPIFGAFGVQCFLGLVAGLTVNTHMKKA